MRKNQKIEGYVIGVDGGGTKTVAALANLNGKILRSAKSGPSSPRNIGARLAAKNIADGIEKILSTFIGLPALEEEYKFKKSEIKKEILRQKRISPIFKGNLIIGSDQLVAFRSGTDEKDGVLLIAGTGSVVHGWSREKEVKVSGWGWLADEGSAFFIGQKSFQAIFKDIDGRGPKTLITKIAFRELGVKSEEDLLLKIYSQNPTYIMPRFSIFCDKASQRGDLVAKRILQEAGRELSLSVNTVIRKLTPPFARKRVGFPLVLVGSVFKSKIILDAVKKEVKRIAPKVKFILPKQEPVIGAVKLAIEELK